jgi:hypothetical protein
MPRGAIMTIVMECLIGRTWQRSFVPGNEPTRSWTDHPLRADPFVTLEGLLRAFSLWMLVSLLLRV